MDTIHLQPNKEIMIADSFLEDSVKEALKAARANVPVLIQGESGTGKELIARLIHSKSKRSDGPFLSINCAAIPDGLIESEFFGYERGAFTGALTKKVGRFELANGGSFLLDEVSEMPFHLQAKLLRVIQEGEMDRLGGKFPVALDVRILATTNREIESLIKSGEFREDLFFRINVVRIELKPLRGRKEAIVELVNQFLERAKRRHGLEVGRIQPSGLKLLLDYPWPGNIRELQNVMERAVVLWDGNLLDADYLSRFLLKTSYPEKNEGKGTLAELEQKYILETLALTGGRQQPAADRLGITARTLRNKLKTYRLDN